MNFAVCRGPFADLWQGPRGGLKKEVHPGWETRPKEADAAGTLQNRTSQRFASVKKNPALAALP